MTPEDIELLRRLKQLLDDSVLTAEEFDFQKRALLDPNDGVKVLRNDGGGSEGQLAVIGSDSGVHTLKQKKGALLGLLVVLVVAGCAVLVWAIGSKSGSGESGVISEGTVIEVTTPIPSEPPVPLEPPDTEPPSLGGQETGSTLQDEYFLATVRAMRPNTQPDSNLLESGYLACQIVRELEASGQDDTMTKVLTDLALATNSNEEFYLSSVILVNALGTLCPTYSYLIRDVVDSL